MLESVLELGSTAPDFSLPTHEGARKSLGEFLERGPLLLAFHRGTW